MRIVRTALALSLAAAVTGCNSSAPKPAVNDAPPSPADLTLCALLTAQDFRDAGAGSIVTGTVSGGGSAQSVTCTYGTDLQMVVQILPTVDNASAIYQVLVGSGWFANDTRASPVSGVDESLYGTGPDGGAVVLRRRTLIILVTMPGNGHDSALVQLATKALNTASTMKLTS